MLELKLVKPGLLTDHNQTTNRHPATNQGPGPTCSWWEPVLRSDRFLFSLCLSESLMRKNRMTSQGVDK